MRKDVCFGVIALTWVLSAVLASPLAIFREYGSFTLEPGHTIQVKGRFLPFTTGFTFAHTGTDTGSRAVSHRHTTRRSHRSYDGWATALPLEPLITTSVFTSGPAAGLDPLRREHLAPIR